MPPESEEIPNDLAGLQQRVRESWVELQKDRQRAIEERASSETFLRKQHEALAAREADLERQQQRMATEIARFDAAIASRMKELEALDTRVVHTYQTLQEVQKLREALSTIPEAEPVDDEEEPAAAHESRPPSQAKATDLTVDDQRLLLAEQFTKLARAQEQWQDAERATVDELEDLAHVLRRRERELDERERDLLQADRRRREDNYDLWQRRLQLDGWRGVLTAHEAWWHTERGRQEAELAEHRARITRRELAVSRLLVKWSEKLRAERNRLRAEVEQWSSARFRLDAATESCDRRQQEALAALKGYAARSLALDETFRQTLDLSDDSATVRHFKLLEKRWLKTFAVRLREIDDRIETARKERRATEALHREQFHRQADLAERTAILLMKSGEQDRERLQMLPDPYARPAPIANTQELASLRAEVERLAFVLLNADWARDKQESDGTTQSTSFHPEVRIRAA